MREGFVRGKKRKEGILDEILEKLQAILYLRKKSYVRCRHDKWIVYYDAQTLEDVESPVSTPDCQL